MKRLMILCSIAIAGMVLCDAQTMNVSLNKEYSDSSGFVLPDKAIKQKMSSIAIANPKYDFTVMLRDILKRITIEDYENNVFTVMLQFSGVGISIVIDSQDILDMKNTKFHGDLIVDRRHFVLLENNDNKDLLKTYFKKQRGKDVTFERTFEKVSEIIIRQPTHYNAIYNERQQTVKVNEFIVNNQDKLHAPAITNEDNKQEQNTDDSDAFKIDVELFDE